MISISWTLYRIQIYFKSHFLSKTWPPSNAHGTWEVQAYITVTHRDEGNSILSRCFDSILNTLYTRKSAHDRNLACPKRFRVLWSEPGVVAVEYSQLLRLLKNNPSNRYEFISYYYATVNSKINYFFLYIVLNVFNAILIIIIRINQMLILYKFKS